MEVKSSSPKETQKIAKDLTKSLKAGDTIALYGDLGAGKTVFVQGLAKGLAIAAKITSPTFVFMRTYPVKIKGENLTLYHIDLYRGQNSEDFESLGLGEILDSRAIVILEWADKIKNILPKKRIDVVIEKLDEKSRRIKIDRH